MADTPWWASEDVWRKWAIWITAFMAVVLIFLTFDTVAKITAGGKRVPGYDVINKRIYYTFNAERNMQEPVIGDDAPLFGKMLGAEEAEERASLPRTRWDHQVAERVTRRIAAHRHEVLILAPAWLRGWDWRRRADSNRR